jgi:hypothetical protein
MKYIGKTLWLDFEEFVPSVMNKKNYDYHRVAGNIEVLGVGGNGRNVFIQYESLPSKYKEKADEFYSGAYQYALKQPLLNAITHDQAAQDFYTSYVLPNGLKLPASDTDLDGKPQINYVSRYTTAANWLNMLQELTKDKTTLKKEFNISIMEFWKAVFQLIKIKGVKLPATRKHLLPKLKAYTVNGFESLIETHKFGNSFSAKVADETAKAYLFQLLSLRNKHADTTVSEEYAKYCVEFGCEPITPEAVGYWRKKWHLELSIQRDGISKTISKYTKNTQRDRPSAPLLLLNGDDNNWDVYFKGGAKTDWYRPALYVVIDAYNDYILGYAWGHTITKEVIKEAFRNAHRHIQELTGDNYIWQQLQTDRWGISGKNTTDIEQFYNSTSTYFPSGLETKGSNYIEQSFGSTWHKILKKAFPKNYAGHNITAKQRLNSETLKTKDFPHIDQAPKAIHLFIEAMRQTKRSNSDLTRKEEWLQAFNASEKSKKRCLPEEQRFLIFGKRNLRPNSLELQTNSITKNGITVKIDKKEHIYELSQWQIAKYIGTKMNVIYDEANLDSVLLTDGDQLRFVAHKYIKNPAALADYTAGTAALIKARLEEKKVIMPYIQGFAAEKQALLDRAGIDAESRLQAGVLVKEITYKDQQLITAKNNGATVLELPVDDEDDIDPFEQIRNR